MGDLRIKACVLEMVSTNCYIVYREKEAVVIDPTDNGAYIVGQCRELEVTPMAVLLIHGHFDRIMAVDDLRKLSFPVYAGADEETLLGDMFLNLGTSFGHSFIAHANQYVKDGEMFSLLGRAWKVVATPSHTSGPVYYLMDDEDMLFSGDILLTESLGRTGFPTKSSGQIVASTMKRPFPLRGDITVYPGYSEPITIGHEKQYNPAAAYRR